MMTTTTTAALSEAACRAQKPPSAQRRLTGVELKNLYFRNGSGAGTPFAQRAGSYAT